MDINKKVCLENNLPNANSDRISSLPDAILQHVLSFLEINHAVQTCVLSRRWQYVWTNIPCLNFKYGAFPLIPANYSTEKRDSFVLLMHQIISCRCSSDIHKFSFFANAAVGARHLRSLVNYALQRNVQIVEITYSNVPIPNKTSRKRRLLDRFEMPDLMYTSKSLRVLKLTGCDKESISLPRRLNFITLKELHLSSISLWDDDTIDRELISDCPNLEHLTLASCDFGELQSLKITAPQLTNLEILFPLVHGFIGSPGKCNVIVSAPKLSSFKYDYHLPLVCSMGNPLNIDTVDINIWEFYKVKKIEEYYFKRTAGELIAMLREFQHAKSVTLSSRAVKILSRVPGVLDPQLSPFCNLKNFRMDLRGSSFFRGLSYILQNSPGAETTLLGSSLWKSG